MEVTATKSLSLAIAVVSAFFLLSPRVCIATAVKSENGTTPLFLGAGHPENGLVGDDVWQLEAMMDSHISRMLLDVGSVTKDTDKSQKQAVDCARGKPYRQCLPPPNPGRQGEKCGTYKRDC